MKNRLNEVLVEARTAGKSTENLLKINFEIRKDLDSLQKELSQAESSWLLKLAQMDKEALKEYGSNEAIRRAKFEQENVNIYSGIKEKQELLKSIGNDLELLRNKLSSLKFEKDCLIALLSI